MLLMPIKRCVSLAILLIGMQTAAAADVRVAVAANFQGTLNQLAVLFEAQTGHTLSASSGSSGALYTHIINGAPFDVFLSADARRPALLAESGHGVADTRQTYAIGIPVLWSPRDDLPLDDPDYLRSNSVRFIAIADPRTAPYGQAAQEIFERIGVWETVSSSRRLVRAQNVGQAWQQVASGAADVGVVALAQVRTADGSIPGSSWRPAADMHTPIEQQAILLSRAADNDAARALLSWLSSADARRLIEAAGYGVADD